MNCNKIFCMTSSKYRIMLFLKWGRILGELFEGKVTHMSVSCSLLMFLLIVF